MFNATELMIDSFVNQLKLGYHRTYGGYNPSYKDIIAWAGNMALENIANGDSLYRNIEQTILPTLVGQEILRGKHIREGGVSCEDWLHFIISLLCHNIGYLKGVCRQDREGYYATGLGGNLIALPEGATDASLTPYRVDRSKLFVDERFGGHKIIDAEQIKRNIEATRFPLHPETQDFDTVTYPGLVRAASLIGQIADPRYLKKIGAIYYEFEETGLNQELGYRNPGDLRKQYPKHFWNTIHPYIRDALRYLSLTQQGKQVIANLQANVFVIEHEKTEEEEEEEIHRVRVNNGAA